MKKYSVYALLFGAAATAAAFLIYKKMSHLSEEEEHMTGEKRKNPRIEPEESRKDELDAYNANDMQPPFEEKNPTAKEQRQSVPRRMR